MLKVGDTCYFKDHWTEGFIKGIIICVNDDDYVIEVHHTVNHFGEKLYDRVGTQGAKKDETFETIEELVAYSENKSQKQVDLYLQEIKTIEDFIQFPLNHCINGNEYTDYDALTAYKQKAASLFNVTIS